MISFDVYRLKSKDPAARRRAVVSIGKSHNPKRLSILQACLDDHDATVVRQAVAAIAAAEEPEALEALHSTLRHANAEARQAAATALSKRVTKDSAEEFVPLLRDHCPAVREAAARALARLGWQAGDPELQTQFNVLLGNARAAITGGEAAIDPLVEGLRHDTAFVRRNVAEALEFLRDPRVVEPLLAAAADPDVSVRISAIHALGKVADTTRSTPVLKTLLQDSNPKVRLAAAEAIAGIAGGEHAPALAPLLKDSNYEVRMCAARFLGKLRDPAMVPLLTPALHDPDGDVRRTAVDGLAACGSSAALPRLILALADDDMGVRNAAATALNSIDPNWRQSDCVRSAWTELEATLVRRPAWVRAAVSQLLSPGCQTPVTLRMAAR